MECDPWICSGANRPCCGPTRSWWSWINTRDGVALCRMFNRAIRGQHRMPNFLSSDNDPLYRFHQLQANLRILDVTEIKSVPYVPLSHPFAERLIGTVRREYLEQLVFEIRGSPEQSILISDTSGCVIFRRLSIAPVSGHT